MTSATPQPRAGEHTPGPWRIWKGDAGEMKYLVGSDGQGFAHTVGLGEPRDTANAQLICSAPSLLAERDALRAQAKELVEALSWVLAHEPGIVHIFNSLGEAAPAAFSLECEKARAALARMKP